jgi:hypothetical protein
MSFGFSQSETSITCTHFFLHQTGNTQKKCCEAVFFRASNQLSKEREAEKDEKKCSVKGSLSCQRE